MIGVRRTVGFGFVAVLFLSGCGDASGPPSSDRPLEGEVAESGAVTADDGVTDDGAGEVAAERVPVTIRFVSQNLLHGIGCPADSGRCQLDARVGLFTRQLSEAGCPDMVSIQEANVTTIAAIEAHPAVGCDYTMVWDDDEGLDREVVLTTLDVVDSRRLTLAGRFRSAFLVRAESPIGAIDFVTTHLASSDNRDCDPATCPPPCEVADQVRTCQVRQILEWSRALGVGGGTTVIGGDLNARVGRPSIDLIIGEGFVDSHVAAGLAECDEESGLNCTSGRDSTTLVDMTDPASLQHQRIDYLFYEPGRAACTAGEGTGLFNAEPATGVLTYPSDHTGVVLVLECVAADRPDDVAVPTLPAEPDAVDEPAGGVPDPATEAAISSAYETFFDGSISDLELRLAQVENGEQFEDVFTAQVAAVGALAAETSARVESITLVDDATADVVYTILVAGGAVFDHVDGNAVRVEGRWLVGQDTFCDLAGQDPSNEPGACG